MEKLDLVLSELADINLSIESLITILKNMEELYNINNEIDIEAILNISVRTLDSLNKDMKRNIDILDNYIIVNRKAL